MIQGIVLFHVMSVVLCSLLPDNDLLGNQFGVAVHNIARKYFAQDKPVVVQTTDSFACSYKSNDKVHYEQTLFELLSKDYQLITFGCKDEEDVTNDYKIKAGSVVIMLPPVDIATQIKQSFFIILRIMRKIGDMLGNVVFLSSYVSRTESEQEQIALALLNTQWEQSFLSEVIVLLPELGWSFNSQNKLLEIEVFTWFVENQRVPCLTYVQEVTLIDRWISQEKGFRNNSNLFPLKKITNLHGCVLKVFSGNFEPYLLYREDGVIGILPHIFYHIGKALNISFVYGTVDRVGADIYFPVWLADNKILPDDCSLLSTFSAESLYWYVPVVRIPRWQAIIRVFDYVLWSLITLTFVFGSMTFWLFSKLQYPDDTSVVDILMNTLLTYIGCGIHYKYNGILVAIFFSLWLFYCLLIYTAYQSQLYSMLTYLGEYDPIRTEEELNKSGFGKYSSIISDPTPTELQYPYMPLQEALTNMYKYRNISVIASNNFLDNDLKYVFTDRGKPQILKLQKPLITLYMALFYKLKCIISKRINDMLKRYYYNGSFQFLSGAEITHTRNILALTEKEELFVPLDNFQSVFYLLLIGLFFAFLVFIFEIIYHNVKRNICSFGCHLKRAQGK